MTQTPALNLTHPEREYFVSRIRSGIYTINFNGKRLKVLQPTLEQELELNEIYLQAYANAIEDGIKSEKEMTAWMIDKGLWSQEEDNKIEQIKKDIDKLKKEIFKSRINTNLCQTIRAYLRAAESSISKLREKKSFYYSNTCEAIATNEKISAFIVKNTFIDDKLYDFEWGPSMDYVLNNYFSQILAEKTIRYLARTEPWRSFWLLNASNTINLFNKNDRELSIDQRNILVWSKMYDNVYESMESPPESVVEDDDMLDGWFLIQKEQSEKRKLDNEIDSLMPKNQKGDEVFLMANSREDVEKIHSMNSSHARTVKQQREKLIEQRGTVNQIDFADEKLRIGNMAREQFKSNFRR